MTIGFSSCILKYFPQIHLDFLDPALQMPPNITKDTTESEQAPNCLSNYTSRCVNTSQLYNFVLYSRKVFPVK